MNKQNVILDKSKVFAIRIIKMYQYLNSQKKEYILSKQILRSGTSIGANIKEAVRAFSKPDFYMKIGISLKEASETRYWLELLYESDQITKEVYDSLINDLKTIIGTIINIINKIEKQ